MKTSPYHDVTGGKPDTPVCVCGHDIYYHDMIIRPHIVGPVKEEDVNKPTEVSVGKCNENDGHRYTCKCKRFYSIDTWMNELWEAVKSRAI